MTSMVSAEAEARSRDLDRQEADEREARRRKNHNFVQIEKAMLKELRGLIHRSPTAAQLITLMAEKMNQQNALVCSYATLTKITGMSRATLARTIKLLVEEQWLQVVKVGTANAYIINSKVFWQGKGDQKQTVFNATIVAGSDEQDQPIENWDNVKLKSYPFLRHGETALVADKQLAPPDQSEMELE